MKYMYECLVAVCVVAIAASVSMAQVNGDCYRNDMEPIRCTPKPQSFSLSQEPVVNSTCGIPPSEYCLRHTTFLGIESTCGLICDANDTANAHPPALMTDFLLTDQTWWQSENNIDRVRMLLSLRTMVEITVITFDFVSFKPTAFYLEKSMDFGVSFEPFHYFANSCLTTYNIDPDQSLGIDNETTVLCQEIDEAGPGQISFLPTLGRPSANDSIPGFSEQLYVFSTATDIRVTLEGHYYLVPSLLPGNDNGDVYYAIEDFNVVGECQCYGHASSCIIDTTTDEYKCECEHNTDGTFCNRCQPFYQDIPWQRADGNGTFECAGRIEILSRSLVVFCDDTQLFNPAACNCHNHSTECVFNQTIYERTGRTSGGVCLNCDHNTTGRQCEMCAKFYYPTPFRAHTGPDVCTCTYVTYCIGWYTFVPLYIQFTP